MKKGYKILLIIGVILVLGGGACVTTCIGERNGMVDASQAVNKAWGNVESVYQRRLDLIPNLVNTVKGYAQHESETLQAVTDARVGLKKAYDTASATMGDGQLASEAPDNQRLESIQQTQNELMRQAGIYINAVHEAYPDLKAVENFTKLQDELTGTENRINVERQRYNEAVETFNKKILRFPGSIFAWGYSEKNMFKADAAASKAPTVDFTGEATPAVDF